MRRGARGRGKSVKAAVVAVGASVPRLFVFSSTGRFDLAGLVDGGMIGVVDGTVVVLAVGASVSSRPDTSTASVTVVRPAEKSSVVGNSRVVGWVVVVFVGDRSRVVWEIGIGVGGAMVVGKISGSCDGGRVVVR